MGLSTDHTVFMVCLQACQLQESSCTSKCPFFVASGGPGKSFCKENELMFSDDLPLATLNSKQSYCHAFAQNIPPHSPTPRMPSFWLISGMSFSTQAGYGFFPQPSAAPGFLSVTTLTTLSFFSTPSLETASSPDSCLESPSTGPGTQQGYHVCDKNNNL